MLRVCSVVLVAMLLSLAGCKSAPVAPNTNQQAALTGALPYNPLAWKVVTSWINDRDATMSTLYGNDAAVQYARTHGDEAYPAGAVLALVTWEERDDPHWFGAKIPSAVKSVEFVSIPAAGKQNPTYEMYQGSPLEKVSLGDDAIISARIESVLSQRAAVMP
jgi:hypothetical protein